uniref:Uncharacterized protein n=1 Tax=Craspedostauros australis TaxID=1486917 RepID=A0A7R9WVF7_9STRA|mmetsp:Transcript_19803/g.55071  ORF Transcript_19803/g.55071 Transcript_19803/m.55071 type:complete len:255 (+) Transcript_19803:236-1000(+)
MSNSTATKKKGFFGMFRKSKKTSQKKRVMIQTPQEESGRATPPPMDQRDIASSSPASSANSKGRDQTPDAAGDEMQRRAEAEKQAVEEQPAQQTHQSPTSPQQMNVDASAPPSAREAAFSGPTRFDWIDVETSAATKVQANYRRFKVMKTLEESGKSTSAIRNRRRRRKAASRFAYGTKTQVSEDAPSLFNWCGVGLVFGDATEEDDEVYRELQKKRYEEKRKEQAAHEEALRRRFMQSSKEGGRVIEAVEVIE